MYRRYYQRYDGFDQSPQRPIGEIPEDNLQIRDEPDTGISNDPEIIIPEKPSQVEESEITKSAQPPTRKISRPTTPKPQNSFSNIFKRIGKEELLILGLIFIVLQGEQEDDLLLLVLIFLFFAGL